MKKDWMIKESELDDDQIKVLNATLDKSCIVTGCAGSGKSVLALIKAQRIQKERGNNYQIIVFTKALCRYMNSGRKELELVNEFKYHEEWRWKKYLKHYRNGKSFWVYERDDSGNKIPNRPKSDYVIVDEIQDFEEEEIMEFIHATRKNFFFFGDTAQSVYEDLKDTMPVEDIIRLLPRGSGTKQMELYRNYRLPVGIARFVQYIGGDLPPFDETTYKSPEKTIPYILNYSNCYKEIEAIIQIIKKRELTDVAILVPDSQSVDEVANIFSEMETDYELKSKNEDNLDFETTNPKITTYYSAKGLQFETVFIPMGWYGHSQASRKKALYVAMTRTYRDLYITYSGQLPNMISRIPTNLYKTTEIEEVEDI